MHPIEHGTRITHARRVLDSLSNERAKAFAVSIKGTVFVFDVDNGIGQDDWMGVRVDCEVRRGCRLDNDVGLGGGDRM